jgi:hypothetical protein
VKKWNLPSKGGWGGFFFLKKKKKKKKEKPVRLDIAGADVCKGR